MVDLVVASVGQAAFPNAFARNVKIEYAAAELGSFFTKRGGFRFVAFILDKFGGINAKPQFGNFDARAELRNINYQGKRFTATKQGIKAA